MSRGADFGQDFQNIENLTYSCKDGSWLRYEWSRYVKGVSIDYIVWFGELGLPILQPRVKLLLEVLWSNRVPKKNLCSITFGGGPELMCVFPRGPMNPGICGFGASSADFEIPGVIWVLRVFIGWPRCLIWRRYIWTIEDGFYRANL